MFIKRIPSEQPKSTSLSNPSFALLQGNQNPISLILESSEPNTLTSKLSLFTITIIISSCILIILTLFILILIIRKLKSNKLHSHKHLKNHPLVSGVFKELHTSQTKKGLAVKNGDLISKPFAIKENRKMIKINESYFITNHESISTRVKSVEKIEGRVHVTSTPMRKYTITNEIQSEKNEKDRSKMESISGISVDMFMPGANTLKNPEILMN